MQDVCAFTTISGADGDGDIENFRTFRVWEAPPCGRQLQPGKNQFQWIERYNGFTRETHSSHIRMLEPHKNWVVAHSEFPSQGHIPISTPTKIRGVRISSTTVQGTISCGAMGERVPNEPRHSIRRVLWDSVDTEIVVPSDTMHDTRSTRATGVSVEGTASRNDNGVTLPEEPGVNEGGGDATSSVPRECMPPAATRSISREARVPRDPTPPTPQRAAPSSLRQRVHSARPIGSFDPHRDAILIDGHVMYKPHLLMGEAQHAAYESLGRYLKREGYPYAPTEHNIKVQFGIICAALAIPEIGARYDQSYRAAFEYCMQVPEPDRTDKMNILVGEPPRGRTRIARDDDQDHEETKDAQAMPQSHARPQYPKEERGAEKRQMLNDFYAHHLQILDRILRD